MANRRKLFVIDKDFQYYHALVSVFVVVILLNGVLSSSLFFPGAFSFRFLPLGINHFLIATCELLLIALVWRASIRSTHRIVGPMFVFTRTVNRLGEGDFTQSIRLRKKDSFIDLADTLNANIEKINARLKAVKELAKSIEQSASDDQTKALAAKLNSELSAFVTEREESASVAQKR